MPEPVVRARCRARAVDIICRSCGSVLAQWRRPDDCTPEDTLVCPVCGTTNALGYVNAQFAAIPDDYKRLVRIAASLGFGWRAVVEEHTRRGQAETEPE
jgi:hypothetical protein